MPAAATKTATKKVTGAAKRKQSTPKRHVSIAVPKKAKKAAPKKVSGVACKGKVHKVMGEFKRGKLHSGSKKGPAVKKRKQAIAIALSEERKCNKTKA